MNEVNKEIEEWFLDLEDSTLDKIRSTYNRSLKDVQAKAKELQDEIDKLSLNADPNDEVRQSQIRSKVYQLDYQQRLEKQISNLMDVANDENYKTVRAYLYNVYHDGFLTEQYRLMNSGLNITMPINQKLLVKAVNMTYDDIPLSTRIYDNVNNAKKQIISEISRGLSIGMSNQDMARNLQNSMGVSMRKAFQIAQNEGARVRQGAIKDSMVEAKKKGADIVKQWSATLDGKTRPVHRELDGQYAEIDEKFKYSGGEVNAPKEFGIASEDINCRCTLLSVPRWDMTKTHWQRDNQTKQLVEVKNYQDWYNKYYVVNVQQPTIIVYNTYTEAYMGLTKDIGFKTVDISLTKVDHDLLVENANQLNVLESKFGVIHGSGKPMICAKNNGSANAYTSCDLVNPSEQSLSLCPKAYKDRTLFIANKKFAVKSGYSMPCDLTDEELAIYTITHEYGHMLQNKLIQEAYVKNGWSSTNPDAFINSSGKTAKTYYKWYYNRRDEFRNECKKEIIEIAKNIDKNLDLNVEISQYGSSSDGEFFAEAFANSQLSKPNTIGKAMNIWLERKGLMK